jgi:hypothetical protein
MDDDTVIPVEFGREPYTPDMPYYRWQAFYVYENSDGIFHVLVVDDNGGYVFADRINSEGEAQWMAGVLNAALAAAKAKQAGDAVNDDASRVEIPF